MSEESNKFEKLKVIIKQYKSPVIAFSGGVDSTFLARVTGDILGEKVLLVTTNSSIYPLSELEEAKRLAKLLKLKHRILSTDETDIPGFSDNPPDRCYYCKRELFTILKRIADEEKCDVVFDGSNSDDLNDYRPGRKALIELGIISPLCDAGLTKAEIRELSDQLGLPTADKPSFACLASRFAYGEKITKENLDRVEKAESALRSLGFSQFRVRSHGDIARVELAIKEMEKGWIKREYIKQACLKAGFVYAAIDLEGYRTGSMNETIKKR